MAAQDVASWVRGPLAVQSSVSINPSLTPMQDIPMLWQLWAHGQQVIVPYEDETSVVITRSYGLGSLTDGATR